MTQNLFRCYIQKSEQLALALRFIAFLGELLDIHRFFAKNAQIEYHVSGHLSIAFLCKFIGSITNIINITKQLQTQMRLDTTGKLR
jgi:hypothetical protein